MTKPTIVNGARRVILYRDQAGEWRYKAQASNWRTIDASEEGRTRKSAVLRIIERRYPGVEVVER